MGSLCERLREGNVLEKRQCCFSAWIHSFLFQMFKLEVDYIIYICI